MRNLLMTGAAAALHAAAADKGEKIDKTTGEVTGTDVATAASTAVSLEDEYAALAQDAGGGYANQTSEDVAVPFLVILQPGSKEVLAEGSDAKGGHIINKSTGQLIPGNAGVTFIPATTRHVFVEWVPRDSGGGYVGEHELDSELVKRVRSTQPLGSYKMPDGENELIETYYVYGIALDVEGTGYPAVMAFSSTHIKAYKDWMFRARSIIISLESGRKLTKLPLWSHAYSIRTQRVDKAGNTWYIPVIGFADKNAEASRLLPSSELYQAGKSVDEAVNSGALKAATDTLDGGSEGRGDASPGRGSTEQEDAPY